MDVHNLQKFVESSPNAPRTRLLHLMYVFRHQTAYELAAPSYFIIVRRRKNIGVRRVLIFV
jgi:hypothetical protein